MKTKKIEEVRMMLKKMPSLVAGVLNEYRRPALKRLSSAQRTEAVHISTVSPTLMNVFLQTISISTHNLITQQLRLASPDVLLSPKIEDYDMLEFYRGAEIIQCGYDAAKSVLPKIHSLL